MKSVSSETAQRSTCVNTETGFKRQVSVFSSCARVLRLTVVRNVPQNPGGITQIENPNTPGLHLGGSAHNARVFLQNSLALDVLPPGVSILDAQAHHEIAGMLGNVEGLEQESKRADLKLRDLLIAPVDGEPEINVELPGNVGVLGRYECLEIGYGTGKHGAHLSRTFVVY